EDILFEYRLAEQALALSSDQMEQRPTATLVGVATFADPAGRYFYLQDSSGGVRVDTNGLNPRPIQVGDAFEVAGVIEQGPFAPLVSATTLVNIGIMPLPEPARATYDEAISGGLDSQWVEMQGFVETVEADGDWTRLLLSTSQGNFEAKVYDPSGLEAPAHGATLRLRGVLATEADERRQL